MFYILKFHVCFINTFSFSICQIQQLGHLSLAANKDILGFFFHKAPQKSSPSNVCGVLSLSHLKGERK